MSSEKVSQLVEEAVTDVAASARKFLNYLSNMQSGDEISEEAKLSEAISLKLDDAYSELLNSLQQIGLSPVDSFISKAALKVLARKRLTDPEDESNRSV